MVKSKLIRAASIAVTSVSLAAMPIGLAGASANTTTINQTGFNSLNVVVNKSHTHFSTTNTTNLLNASASLQGASTGDVHTNQNTTVSGPVASGDAANSNATSTGISVSNEAPATPMMGTGAGDNTSTVSNTGAQSTNKVVDVTDTTVTNKTTNNIANLSFNEQQAASGNVTANQNTTVGGVSSGSASNSNSTTTTIEVSN